MRRMLRRGTCVSLRRGVYVEEDVRANAMRDGRRAHALEIAALRLGIDCDVVAGGASAACIIGLETLVGPRELTVLTEDDARRCRQRHGYVLRVASLPPHHREHRFGVPVTSTARTVVDIARWGTLAEGVVVADSALRQRAVTARQLADVHAEFLGWRGASRARRALALADPRAESVLESVSRVAMHEQGVPAPRLQVVLGDDEGPFARADFLWDDCGVIGEADGLGKYEPDGRRTTREIVRDEKRREERLAALGFTVVRWGWRTAMNPPLLAERLNAGFARSVGRSR